MSILALLLGSLSTAYAVPVQLSQQGRLLEANGAAVTGSYLDFRLFDSQVGDNNVGRQSIRWVYRGVLCHLLGNNLSNPLDDSVLASSALYLEVSVDGGSPVGVRQPVVRTVFAVVGDCDQSLGNVDANAVSVGGQLVIDNSGSWVGPAMAVNWGDLRTFPLTLLTVMTTAWQVSPVLPGVHGLERLGRLCGRQRLTEAEVEAFVTNGALDFAAGSMVGGSEIVTLSTERFFR